MDLKVCRLCCDKQASLNIFNSEKQLLHKIMYCCSKLNIKEGDGLPALVCLPCEQELISCYQFVLKCEASEKKLHFIESNKCSPKIEIKSEIECQSDDQQYEDIPEVESDEVCKSKLDIKDESKDVKVGRGKHYKKRIKFKALNPFSCVVCGRHCPNQSSLAIHMRSHTNERPYPCLSCDKSYKDRGGLKRHTVRNHLEDKRERNFICEHCGKGFYSRNDVTIHMRTHTGETPYGCPLCPMRFTQISAMLRHKRRHTGEKTHGCPECSKRFCTKEELKSHLCVHSNEKNYTCPICNISIKYRNNLKKHIRMHSEKNKFVCNHCGRTFASKGNLKIHIDRQHSEKSGHCSVCVKSVANIEMHMWRHTGQRPLKCELCSSSFYELKALAHHINFKHTKTDKYKCQVVGCLKSFPSRPMLDFHTAKLHETQIPFPCDRCARGFYRKNDLARHKISTHKERLM